MRPAASPARVGSPRTEAEPAQAAEVFGAALPDARIFAGLLVTEGVQRGLIGPREPERIWTRHLLNATQLAPHVPRDSTVVDIGSGAGIPGIPLALARPDLSVVLLEPMQRRVEFLQLCCEQLGLSVPVVRARAEEAKVAVEVAVARAVAPLDRLAVMASYVLARPGLLLALKGRTAAAELAQARAALGQLGAVAEIIIPPTAGLGSAVVAIRFPNPPRHTGRRRARSVVGKERAT